MWKEMHENLGCEGCQFCDSASLWIRPCCTYIGKTATDADTDKCINRRPKSLADRENMHSDFSYNKEFTRNLQQKFNEVLSKKNGIDIYKDTDKLAEIGNFFNIYYRRRPDFRPNAEFFKGDAIMDDIISRDYGHLVFFWGKKDITLSDIFMLMQGDVWSPNGEARELIRLLGLRHTSMSVGDLIANATDGMIYEVAGFGFNNISCGFKTEIKTTQV